MGAKTLVLYHRQHISSTSGKERKRVRERAKEREAEGEGGRGRERERGVFNMVLHREN